MSPFIYSTIWLSELFIYFCGEILDLDALTGGYNLQIAWSTGYLAGDSVR